MNLKLKRKEIRKKYFATGGLVIVSILGIIGMILVFSSGIFNIKNTNMLYNCISKSGIFIIFGVFFFIVSFYCWMLFFLNIIINPKKEILYLYKNENSKTYFLNKKGKKFTYDKNNLKENSYYYVLKTNDYIYDVLEETNENWIPKEKKSYWLNCYSPMGNYEDVFLLPIFYVILLIGIFMLFNQDKISGLIMSVVSLYEIIYDLIYKIKLKKQTHNIIDDEKFYKSYEFLKNTILIVLSTVICVILIIVFLKLSDMSSKLIFFPFLCFGIFSFGLTLSRFFKNYKLEKIFNKGSIIIFLIYYLGFVSFWTIKIIKQEGNYFYALYSIPFFIVGFLFIYKYFIKNKQ